MEIKLIKPKIISFQDLFHIVIFETKVCTDFSVIKFNFHLTESLAALGLCRCTWAASSFGEQGLLSVQSSGSRAHGLRQLQPLGSVVTVHGLSCSTACGIFLDEGLNLCPLNWQLDS